MPIPVFRKQKYDQNQDRQHKHIKNIWDYRKKYQTLYTFLLRQNH